MDIDRADLAIRLVEERARIGYSQNDFATKLGISREGLRLYEAGQRGISAEILARAAILGMDVQYVLTGIRSSNVSAIEQAAMPSMATFIADNKGNVVSVAQAGATIHQITTQRHITRTVADVKPGEEHISDEQAAVLLEFVNKIVETETSLKKKPGTHRSVWGALNAHCGVPKYRLIKREDFQKAQKYLRMWIGRLDSMGSAPTKNGDAWRKRKYAYIKINTKDDPDVVSRYIKKNFDAASLTSLSNDQLEQTYRYVAGRKSRS
ncbi:MAG: helix-turn-helix domain-containing protein [Zoogloeaceae bacterium]|jgi:transcriptional regulator with XRE-family HTH domain|nr:helix-turn-helix domain-containing protein [Zoogloeaceae bacterium]